MSGDGDREFLDQHAEFIDLADDRLDAVAACGICRHHPALDGGEPAPELCDLTREVSGAARQIRDLAADRVDAVAACGICRHPPALDGGEPAPELCDLTREVSGAARQIRDLA